MTPDVRVEVPRNVRDLITNLRLLDEQTGGRPVLEPSQTELARMWVSRILVRSEELVAHTELLEKLYRTRFTAPLPRRYRANPDEPAVVAPAEFRHHALLPDERADAILQRGPDALAPDELATLLLNPFALWDLTEQINLVLPAYWLPELDRAGEELLERCGVDLTVPGEDEAPLPEEAKVGRALARLRGVRAGVRAGETFWELLFEDEAAQAVARRMAAHAYGDPGRDFRLTLYRVPVAGEVDRVRAEVEVSPAPTRSDLVLTVTFPVGESRTFTLEVPPEVKADPEAEPREATRSEPSEPLPLAAFQLRGESEWREDGAAFRTVLRSFPLAL